MTLEQAKELFKWKDCPPVEHAWNRVNGLYGDWIDSGKLLSFEDYKEMRRKQFYLEYHEN